MVPSDATAHGGHRGWPRGLSIFQDALKLALCKHGESFQPEAGVIPVHAADLEHVRKEFYATYAEAEQDKKKRAEKMRKAFNRSLSDAQSRKLLKSHHIEGGPYDGRTMLWLPERGGNE